MSFAIDKKIKGVRGFIVKILDSQSNLQELYDKYKGYWPYRVSDQAKSPWNSIHFEFGQQPWFHKDRVNYDIDS